MLATVALVLASLTQVSPRVFNTPMPLTQWQTAKAGPRFGIEGSTFELTGGRGWTRTKGVLLDYRLTLEYRLATPDAEGAVLVRATAEAREAWPISGYRIAISADPASKRALGSIAALSKKGAQIANPSALNAPPVDTGQWHQLEVDVVRNLVIVRIDGRQVSQAEGTEEGAGCVGLEHVKGTILFRNVEAGVLTSQPIPTGVAVATGNVKFAGRSPTVVTAPKPHYTVDAMEGHVTGHVTLDVVIDETGVVAESRITKSLHPDLDLEALAAAHRWRFRPATIDGKAVPIVVTIDMEFKLH
jgi:TonB family protein